MRILGIETSCDETGAAVIEGTTKDQPVRLLSNSLATSLASHAATGGIIPENAAREQVKFILPVINEAIKLAGLDSDRPAIDAIAITYGPGLIGSLLVGIETAKTLSSLWKIPVIPVNHMYGHIYANWIANDSAEHWAKSRENKNPLAQSTKPLAKIEFPAIALVVSGGHTDIVLLNNHGDLKVLGGTRDDAAGEAFDKIGRLFGLQYPAGPAISKLAESGNPQAFVMPRPMWDSKDYDFSFSGLKTSVLNLIKRNGWEFREENYTVNSQLLSDLCASVQKAIIDVLVYKTLRAVKEFSAHTLLLGGGVAANQALREEFKVQSFTINSGSGMAKTISKKLKMNFFVPQKSLCTDNAAMIAAAGFYNDNYVNWEKVTANPELYY